MSFRLSAETASSRKGASSGKKSRLFQLLLVSAQLILFNNACLRAPKAGPVPLGEPVSPRAADASGQQRLLTLAGRVVDREGIPIPGAQVEAAESASGRSAGTAVADGSGRFKLNLPAGRYKITASLHGFFQQSSEVTLQPALSAEISISMGEQIPIGEPIVRDRRPVRKPGEEIPPGGGRSQQDIAIDIIECTFADDTGLHKWLNGQTDQHKAVRAIIPLRDQTSLFCVMPGPAVSYTVIAVDGAPDREKIQARADLTWDKSFGGVHRLAGRFLIVFSHGN